jgi:hypothetical protein
MVDDLEKQILAVAGFRRFAHYLELDADGEVAYQPKGQTSIFCNSCSWGNI